MIQKLPIPTDFISIPPTNAELPFHPSPPVPAKISFHARSLLCQSPASSMTSEHTFSEVIVWRCDIDCHGRRRNIPSQ